MAVRIPIITVFDSKGLRQAQYQLKKVEGNISNLGRNFAIAGAAIAGAFVLIGKSVQDAAQAQAVFAQTEAVLKSTGTTANGTAKQISALSESLMKLSGFDDEAIQSGNNLILTFKNIKNAAGAGNDIFDRTSLAMVDLARVMKTGPEQQAIRLGKALNDPIRGVSALAKAGVQFSDDQKATIKTLVQTGDLLGAQKIVLAELESQIGGSAAAYGKTFAGQVDILRGELGNLSEELGVMVMPALRELVSAFRELAPEVGEKLKLALGSVDWSAFAKTIADTVTFLVQNAEAIIKVVAALFTLNTLYNAGRVAVGLYNAAAVILGKTFTVTAGKIGLATGALKFFKIALITTGIGALVVALGLIVQGATEVDSTYRKTTPVVTSFGTAVLNSGKDAEWAAGKYGIATAAAKGLASAASGIKPDLSGYMDAGERRNRLDTQFAQSGMTNYTSSLLKDDKNGGSTKTLSGMKAIRQNLQVEVKKQTAIGKLATKGISAGLAGQILGGPQPLKTANKIINGTKKAAKKLQNLFNKTSAGISEIAESQQEADNSAELAALAEKERQYKSFADSVASTFSSIKDSIMGAFSLPELGGSTDSIIRNMDKLLARVKDFSANITKLSSMGLDPKLLQQVINSGPIAGAKLAANLVAGGAGALGAINAGYAELGTVAGEIGMTGTQALFGTQAQQTVYNINVSGGLDTGATIGKAVVDAVKAYERTSGPVWQGA